MRFSSTKFLDYFWSILLAEQPILPAHSCIYHILYQLVSGTGNDFNISGLEKLFVEKYFCFLSNYSWNLQTQLAYRELLPLCLFVCICLSICKHNILNTFARIIKFGYVDMRNLGVSWMSFIMVNVWGKTKVTAWPLIFGSAALNIWKCYISEK
jgi:hypothetical protein